MYMEQPSQELTLEAFEVFAFDRLKSETRRSCATPLLRRRLLRRLGTPIGTDDSLLNM